MKLMEIPPLSRKGSRKFGLVMAAFIALVFGLILPWVFNKPMTYGPWIVSSVFAVWAWAIPNTLFIIYKPWMIVGHLLGLLNTKILLSFIFYFVFTPISLLFKMVGKDAMHRKWHKGRAESYWKTSKKQSKNHMENVY